MRILIIKTSALGDIIQTFPVLSYLRQKFPEAQIDWIVESNCAELLEAHSSVNHIFKIESRKWRNRLWSLATLREIKALKRSLNLNYDLVFDLQGNLKSAILLFLTRAKKKIGFGWESVSEWPNVFFTHQRFNPPKGKNIREDYLSVVQSFFKDPAPFKEPLQDLKIEATSLLKLEEIFSCRPTLVCPGANWKNKRLDSKTLLEFLKKLNRGPYFFIWGNEEEREEVQKLSAEFPGSKVLEKMSLPVLQQAMKRCQLVVAMDSLPLHLCGTTSTPTLSFFGPSSSQKYAPKGKQHQSVQGICPYKIEFEKRCSKLRTCPTGACMKSPKLDLVYKDIEKVP